MELAETQKYNNVPLVRKQLHMAHDWPNLAMLNNNDKTLQAIQHVRASTMYTHHLLLFIFYL